MTCKIQLITMLIIFFSSIIYNFTQNFILYKKKTIKQEIKILTTWKIYHIRNSQLLKLCLSAKLRFYDSISQIPRRASPFKKFIESKPGLNSTKIQSQTSDFSRSPRLTKRFRTPLDRIIAVHPHSLFSFSTWKGESILRDGEGKFSFSSFLEEKSWKE